MLNLKKVIAQDIYTESDSQGGKQISAGSQQCVLNKYLFRISLVAQWLRILLPMQGTRVQALVQEDLTCRGATKPVRHNYWDCALEPTSHSYWSPRAAIIELRVPRARAPQQEKPLQWEAHTPQRRVAPARRNQRKPVRSNEDPTQPKINK